MTKRLNVGIIGGGLITQVEHLPNLLNLPAQFRVVGVADPSAKVRAFLKERRGVDTFATADEIFALKPDAVVIATPDPYHVELAIAALERGIHVFVEKPLCYDPAEAQRVAAARDKTGRVVQLGYMKRFDPALRVLSDKLKGRGASLRTVHVEVLDPDAWPFTAHNDVIAGDDVDPALIADNSAKRAAQVAKALGFAPENVGLRGFAGPFSSSLVHDINAVQDLLDSAGLKIGTPIGAAFFAGSDGGYASARLTGADAIFSMSWVALPKLSHYSERISVVLDDAQFVLTFPSPYLNHHLTTLIERRSDGHHVEEIAHRISYAEAFVEELKSWHRAMVEGTPVVNTVEQAGRDMTLLRDFARLALGH